jgi:hypothetical protein
MQKGEWQRLWKVLKFLVISDAQLRHLVLLEALHLSSNKQLVQTFVDKWQLKTRGVKCTQVQWQLSEATFHRNINIAKKANTEDIVHGQWHQTHNKNCTAFHNCHYAERRVTESAEGAELLVMNDSQLRYLGSWGTAQVKQQNSGWHNTLVTNDNSDTPLGQNAYKSGGNRLRQPFTQTGTKTRREATWRFGDTALAKQTQQMATDTLVTSDKSDTRCQNAHKSVGDRVTANL